MTAAMICLPGTLFAQSSHPDSVASGVAQRALERVAEARSPNQISTAWAADHLPADNLLARALGRLTTAQKHAALDRINPEGYASLQTSLLLQAYRINQGAAARLRTQQGRFARQRDDDARNGLWVDAQGHGGHLATFGNAAPVRDQDNLISIGYDRSFGHGWLVGVTGAGGRGEQRISERDMRSNYESRYAGVYLGKHWGGFGLRAGALVSRQKVKTDRASVIGTLRENEHAEFHEQGRQGLLEAGYEFGLGKRVTLQPYLQWSRVQITQEELQEGGGIAALHVAERRHQVDFGTGGLRLDALLSPAGGQDWLQFGGTVAYRVDAGNRLPLATAQWQGGEAFSVVGVPLLPRALLWNVHVGARLSRNSLLELGYDGTQSRDGREHVINARYSLNF